MWLYLDSRKCVMSYNYGNMQGNTDWVHYHGELPGENLTDEHGAALYQMFDGVVLERPLSERMMDWGAEPEPEATIDDYRDMLRDLGVDV